MMKKSTVVTVFTAGVKILPLLLLQLNEWLLVVVSLQQGIYFWQMIKTRGSISLNKTTRETVVLQRNRDCLFIFDL